jgi:predicted DNA-binding transcriptional regulator YafY
MAKVRGRPKGSFTQHERFADLQRMLEQHPTGLSLQKVALELGVSTRTARRYLKQATDDYHLDAKRVQGGHRSLWTIPANQLRKRVELRHTQAIGLLATRRVFEPLKGSALYDELQLAIERLLLVASRPSRGTRGETTQPHMEERFVYLPNLPKAYETRAEDIDVLFQAVSEARPISCQYRSRGHAKEELITLCPYAMVLYRDSLYTVGQLGEAGLPQVFMLDRMRGLHCDNTARYEPPKGFDLETFFQGEFGLWRGDELHKVVIDFDAEAAETMRMRRVHTSQRLSGLPGGGVRLALTLGSLEPVVGWLLGFGSHVHCVEPKELRERVAVELEKTLALYEAGRERRGKKK